MSIVHAEKVPEALQRHWAFHGARMLDRDTYKSQDVYLSDGGPHFDAANKADLPAADEWMRKGYYVTAWAVQKGTAVIGYPLYFKIDHDMNYPPEERQKRRMRSAFNAAAYHIDLWLHMGLLERYSNNIIIPPDAVIQ